MGKDVADTGMLELFRSEAKMHSESLESGLLKLEKQPESKELLEPLMRAAHSIKGAARIVGLDAAVGLAHAMEDIFVAAQEDKKNISLDVMDILLQAVDIYKRFAEVEPPDFSSWLDENHNEIEIIHKKVISCLSTEKNGTSTPNTAIDPPGTDTDDIQTDIKEINEDTAAPEKPDNDITIDSQSNDDVLVSPRIIQLFMNLTGECMIEALRLKSFNKNLMVLKKNQNKLNSLINSLHESSTQDGSDGNQAKIISDLLTYSGKCRENLISHMETMDSYSHRFENISTKLYNHTIAARMRPFSDVTKSFPRLIRDVSKKLGKKIDFKISGASTKVDRDILEKLDAPLNHILHNCCDHGIETIPERLEAGKPETGFIVINAFHKAGMLSIVINDDGRGIDPEIIKRKILEKKMARPDIVEAMTESEILDFLLLPGFSTSESVTKISGRGVGLDVVHSMIQEVKGRFHIQNIQGKGVSFHLQLPVTLSVLRGLTVEINSQPYSFPLIMVDRLIKITPGQVDMVEDVPYCCIDGKSIGLVHVQQVLEMPYEHLEKNELNVVIISDSINQYGVVVDRFIGEHDLVVRPLDKRLGKVPNIIATSFLEDSTPVLIIDVEDLVRSIDNMLYKKKSAQVTHGSTDKREKSLKRKRILVVDDSITVREMGRRLLEKLGYGVETAVDGMDGWHRARSGRFDLVIADVDMPRMNGIEMVKNIKRDGKLKDIPVMIVSYKDRKEDKQRGLNAGADYYLTKSSFHDDSLIQAVEDLIGTADIR